DSDGLIGAGDLGVEGFEVHRHLDALGSDGHIAAFLGHLARGSKLRPGRVLIGEADQSHGQSVVTRNTGDRGAVTGFGCPERRHRQVLALAGFELGIVESLESLAAGGLAGVDVREGLSLSIRGFEELLQRRFVELLPLLGWGVAAVPVLPAVLAARTARKVRAGDERDVWECVLHVGPLESALSGAISGRRAATAINLSPTRRLRPP